jgi:hypothetical protein
MAAVSELMDAQLDFYAGLADGIDRADLRIIEAQRSGILICAHKGIQVHNPSTSWMVGGPMLGRMIGKGYGIFKVKADNGHKEEYCCYLQGLPKHAPAYGDTPLVAACRALVLHTFGADVEEIEVTQ